MSPATYTTSSARAKQPKLRSMIISPTSPVPVPDQASQFNQALQSNDVGTTIRLEITQLGDHIQTVDRLFSKAQDPLREFDARYLELDVKAHLAPQWQAFHERFSECVDSSYTSAKEASETMRLYAEAVLGKVRDTKCNVGALMREVNLFLKRVERHELSAETMHRSFKSLAANVNMFESDTRRLVEQVARSLNIPPSHIMFKAWDSVTELNERIARLVTEMAEKEAGFLQKMTAYTSSAASALCTLSPKAVLQAIMSAYTGPEWAIDADTRATQAQLEAYAKQMPSLTELSEIPVELQSLYQDWWSNTKKDIRGVTIRIGAIFKIWHNLRHDLLGLQKELEHCVEEYVVSEELFLMEKIDISRTLCKRLIECLELYVYQVPPKYIADAEDAA